MYNNDLKEPLYFHREYENDLPKQETKTEESSQALRVAKVALPFVALYRPFGRTLACGLSAARTVTTLSECFAAEDYQKLSWALFNTCLAVGSVAGTIFLHPLGMLITTLSDIGMNVHHVYGAISRGEMYEAGKQSMHVANNTFYLAMLMTGSIELQLASLALQVLVEGGASYEEFNKDNILESIGHVGMCMVRMNQSHAQLGMLQQKWKAESLSQIHAMKAFGCNHAPKPVGHSAQKASALEVVCSEEGIWHPALGSLKEQHEGYLVYADLTITDEDGDVEIFGDLISADFLPQVKAVGDSGDLVAVWLDADASGLSDDLLTDAWAVEDYFEGLDKFLYISQYNASTGFWSVPNGRPAGDITWSFLSADPAGNAVILLQNARENALEAITFNNVANKWSSTVELADHLPIVTSFDADHFGNCTLAWGDKDNLFTARSYDTSTQTWDLPVSFKLDMQDLQNEQIRDRGLIVRRDLDRNITVLANINNFEDEQATYANMFDGKTKQWSVPKLLDLGGQNWVVDLISMGKGQFTGIFADDNRISSLLFDANRGNSDWGSLNPIKSSRANIDHIVVDKGLSGNPIVAWKEEIDEDDMDDWIASIFPDRDSIEENPLGLMAAVMGKILESTKIHVANFDSVKGDWKSTEVASGMIAHPKFARVDGHLHLFWEDFLTLNFSDDGHSSDEEIFPINFNGMKWEDTKGEWNPLGTIFQCPMKENPLNIVESPEGYYYAKFIYDDELHVVWRDGEEYRKTTIPLR